ncbi:serine/threonine-protein phosphatase PP1-like [Histomonas meleagridis]|uniref:serine/threonine-protein phosphatase PP1-like n=1 Tax=Histomonas meleagridis TaxID=135588 RepID=UPI003559CFCD|nr:serine/threonine-protein phosphatase PP1-like [Histomonas meleagridis]KAH0806612.1 serine/threonine-protein phosphatase PP1-like [Histomonas meleagridis]
MSFRIESILSKLEKSPDELSDVKCSLSSKELMWLCSLVERIFRKENILLSLRPPIVICGDIHGQFEDLLRIFKTEGSPSDTQYLFLGDYVGRGLYSIQTISYLFSLKVKYPDKIFLLRGNHETDEISREDGFFQEFIDLGIQKLWYSFTEVFRWIPLAAIIGGRIFCVHGGISPELKNCKQIEKIKRPLDIPIQGLAADIVWADPRATHDGWKESERGTSVEFGADVVEDFLNENELDLLCRAHEMVMDGFEFPFGENKCCCTVFSAPNYCGSMKNAGAVMKVSNEMQVSVDYFEPIIEDD